MELVRHCIHVTPAAGDIDLLGHVNNVSYVSWIQQAAQSHWEALATNEERESIVWVVLRHEIDYRSSAFEGDALSVQTWVGNARKLRFERFVEIRQSATQTIVVQSKTLWCPVSPTTLKPVTVSDSLRQRFSTGAAGVEV